MLSGQTGGGISVTALDMYTQKTLFIFQSFHHFLLLVLLSPLFNHKINYSFPRYASLTTTKYERKNNETLMMMLDIFKMTRASFIFFMSSFSSFYTVTIFRFIFPERISRVKCSNLKSISLKKLTDLIENLPYTCLEMIYIQKYTAFVRSIYHTTKREYNSKQRDQMEDYKVFDGYLSSADKGGKVL
jgi:hypothetical protein